MSTKIPLMQLNETIRSVRLMTNGTPRGGYNTKGVYNQGDTERRVSHKRVSNQGDTEGGVSHKISV